MFFLIVAGVGIGKMIGSFLSAAQSYSKTPFKHWCRRRVIYFSSAVVSVIAFTLGEISQSEPIASTFSQFFTFIWEKAETDEK